MRLFEKMLERPIASIVIIGTIGSAVSDVIASWSKRPKKV